VGQLQRVFDYEGQQVRTTLIDGQPWFAARDVCDILGIAWQGSKTLRPISDGWKGVGRFPTPGGDQDLLIVNEAALYKLAFRSQKEEADRFTNWVAEEVLPTIRKTGGYVVGGREEEFVDLYFPTLSEETKLMMVKDLQKSVQLMKPKADYFDALVERNLLTNFRDTAKELKVGQREFMAWLEREGFIYRDGKGKPKPYSEHTPDLFEIKEFARGDFAGTQTLITPKGRETFRLLLREASA
jgi:prophage antirepressor-like protein